MQRMLRDMLCLVVHSLQKVVVILSGIWSIGSTEPAGHSAAAMSRQHSRNSREKIFPASSVQNAGENSTPVSYDWGQLPAAIGLLLRSETGSLVKPSYPGSAWWRRPISCV